MYKQLIDPITETVSTKAIRFFAEGIDMGIPCDPANTDYANFKAQINADEAQLEDADGNLMTAEQAKAYVATLP
jgi:hypothetical protein